MISAGTKTVDLEVDSQAEQLAPEWSQQLQATALELRRVAGTTEDEFLAIGSRLQDFYQRGQEVSGLAADMVGEVAGEQVTQAMAGLGDMLDEMGCYLDNTRRELEGSSVTLREILGYLEQVASPLSGFKKVNKVLRMLGISTKIESARLGQSDAGFATLASDVGNLAVQVQEKAGVILARKDDLVRTIQQTLAAVQATGTQQHGQVVALLEKTRSSLAALTEVNARCSAAVTGITEVSEQVTQNIGQVVMSMQSHDIVRQQIEHVDQALIELEERLAPKTAGADEVAAVCELQSAQLRHAKAELEGAVGAIVGNLGEVARQQTVLLNQTGALAGIADRTEGDFFTDMQKDIALVSSSLLESSQVNRNLSASLGAVAATVGEIACFVGDIERIGEEIKLIALNAQIKSAYTGEEGAALGVLAEAIQRLSLEAIEHSTVVSGSLNSIISATEGMNGEASCEVTCLEEEVRGMVERLSAVVNLLQEIHGSLHRSLSRMQPAVTTLSADIGQATSGIAVHHTVSAVLEGALATLGEIARQAGRLAPESSRRADLAEISHRYTMSSERRIHQSLLQGEAAAPAEDELGCNVELF